MRPSRGKAWSRISGVPAPLDAAGGAGSASGTSGVDIGRSLGGGGRRGGGPQGGGGGRGRRRHPGGGTWGACGGGGGWGGGAQVGGRGWGLEAEGLEEADQQ